MPQSLAKVLVHIVYSTKGRHPRLKDKRIRQELYASKATILRSKVDTPALIINGVEDHVHMLCLLSRMTNSEQKHVRNHDATVRLRLHGLPPIEPIANETSARRQPNLSD